MNPTITPESLVTTLNSRYATKKFDATKQVPDTDWNALLESLRLSPSSYGLQPWKFIDVQNPELRKSLRAVSWNQSQVEEASHFVVFTTLRKVDEIYIHQYIEKVAKDRSIGAEMLKGYEDMMVGGVANNPNLNHLAWTQRQAYIAMGFLGLSAGLLGVDTCMLEWLDPAAYDTLLGLDGTDYTTVAAVAVGYRHAEDATAGYAKSRFERESVVEVR
jgi:nitroreductase